MSAQPTLRVLPRPLCVSARDVQHQLGVGRATAYELLRAALGRTHDDPASGRSLRVRLDLWRTFLEARYPACPTSDVRLRRRRDRPCGPWVAWGYDNTGMRCSESTKQIDRKAAEEGARALEADHTSRGAATARKATHADPMKLLLTNAGGRMKASKRSTETLKLAQRAGSGRAPRPRRLWLSDRTTAVSSRPHDHTRRSPHLG